MQQQLYRYVTDALRSVDGSVVALDLPLLVVGCLVLLVARMRCSATTFQAYCQMVGTIAAQIPSVVSISLARIVPFASATALEPVPNPYVRRFVIFVAYCCLLTPLRAVTWQIPGDVALFFGDLRAVVQLVVLISLAACTVGVARALMTPQGPAIFRTLLAVTAVVHGLASLYQYVAFESGLTLIGISRMGQDTADFAAFDSPLGVVVRPGGLSGEPKTVAAFFGMFLLTILFAPRPANATRAQKMLEIGAAVLSAIGFVLAFSTSAFIGAGVALCVLMALGVVRTKTTVRLGIIGAATILVWQSLTAISMADLQQLLDMRLAGRLTGGGVLDTPVEASLLAMRDNPWIAIFGVGLGGSSFLTMQFIGMGYEYAYAPNIALILLLVETGVVGTLLLLAPWAHMVLQCRTQFHRGDPDVPFLLVLTVSAMLLQLSGSGIALGFPLAIGAACALSVRANAPERYAIGASGLIERV